MTHGYTAHGFISVFIFYLFIVLFIYNNNNQISIAPYASYRGAE